MTTTCYLFCHNNVLHHFDRNEGLPLDQGEWEQLQHSISPSSIITSFAKNDTCIIELSSETKLPENYEWRSLRSLVGQVDDRLFTSWGRAAHLLHWYKTTGFCGACGSRTQLHTEETVRSCPSCATHFYPAVSPCIIVLVHRGREILLARSPRFPGKMFSTLAGFIEPGESAEEAVHREIFEEVQVRVNNLRYFRSQSWPFPGQLMLGFFAEYLSGDICVDGVEICEAHWYHPDSLPQIPVPGTIAGRLIRDYISDYISRCND